jgi:Tol biopolymer transport system component
MMTRWFRAAQWGLLLAASGLCGLSPVSAAGADDLAAELKNVPAKIVYETYQDNNWELFMVKADGSHPVNLTRTPNVNEMYPHVSPDGTKVSFVVDEGEGDAKIRNVYCMSLDGTGRTLVAKNAREPCWSGDGSGIVYLKGEFDKYTPTDYATKGICVYNLATGKHWEHPNKELYHLYNVCCTPDGDWFIATVHGGMGYRHAILAIEAKGMKVYDLKIPGCRPDVSHDGKRLAWGAGDYELRIGDLDFSGPQPKVTNQRDVITSKKPMEVYHVDWSPDGKHIAFSRGPIRKQLGPAPEMIGIQAEGWNVCVGDAAATNRWTALTTDGKSNKEPDWAPPKKDKP